MMAVGMLACGFVGIKTHIEELRISFSAPVQWAIPPGVSYYARVIRSKVAPNAPVFYLVNAASDGWVSGLWQRALYPNPCFLVRTDELQGAVGRELRAKFGHGLVMSINNPPELKAFTLTETLPANAGSPTVFLGAMAK
jgi:hypothetical protein